MIFTVNIPQEKVFVRNKYLGLKDNGITEGYLISVTSSPNRPLLFTVHLSTGALFSGLPITALLSFKYTSNHIVPKELILDEAQPYSCLPGNIQYLKYNHLKNYAITTLTGLGDGMYLFTIDVQGEGITDDPEQHKTHNICVLDSGNLIAYPNNKLLFVDTYFTKDKILPKYKRNKKYFTIND